jgi:hypothetical protein
MARATSSLPTPDSPSIRMGMPDAAAFWASRITRSIDGLLPMMSLKATVPPRRAPRLASTSSASTLSALAIAAFSRSGEAGLTTKSNAPSRIADTTVSMPPLAVCTMTGIEMPRRRIASSTPMPSRPGITRSRMMAEIEAASVSRTWSASSPPGATMAG